MGVAIIAAAVVLTAIGWAWGLLAWWLGWPAATLAMSWAGLLGWLAATVVYRRRMGG